MTNSPMNDDPKDPRDPKPTPPAEARVHTSAGGCLSAFVMLWGVALLLVGMLIAAVSGYCGYVFIGGSGAGARDFAEIFITGLIIGVLLCIAGGFLMRRGLDR